MPGPNFSSLAFIAGAVYGWKLCFKSLCHHGRARTERKNHSKQVDRVTVYACSQFVLPVDWAVCPLCGVTVVLSASGWLSHWAFHQGCHQSGCMVVTVKRTVAGSLTISKPRLSPHAAAFQHLFREACCARQALLELHCLRLGWKLQCQAGVHHATSVWCWQRWEFCLRYSCRCCHFSFQLVGTIGWENF